MNIQSEQHECKTVDNNEYLICLNQRLLRYAKQRLLVPPTAEENASWKQMKYEFKQDDEVYINLLVGSLCSLKEGLYFQFSECQSLNNIMP